MAGQIAGKFVADFASFSDAVNKATTQLKGMETDANKVRSSLNRMVDQFSGRKIIQEAELMGKTFELLAEKGIGLTNRELLRMGRVAEEAIAKLKAGGEHVPAEMQKIADAANKVKPALDGAQSSAAGIIHNAQQSSGDVRDRVLGRRADAICRGRCSRPPARSVICRSSWASQLKPCNDSSMPPSRVARASTPSAPRSSS